VQDVGRPAAAVQPVLDKSAAIAPHPRRVAGSERMVRRLIFMMAAMAALLVAAPATTQSVPARIVAVGDLHGDFSAWLDIARDAGLIDPKNDWAGGRTVLVQTGDITDRGPDSLKIIRHLQQLDRQAKAAGGRVVVLLGNHEAMMVTGDLRYVDPGEYAAFADRRSAQRRLAAFEANKTAITAYMVQKRPDLASEPAIRAAWIAETPLGKVEHNSAWAPSGELGKWAATLPAVAKIGDTIFVHGGISANYALVPIVEINRRARVALQVGEQSPESIINDENGPLWYRGLITRTGSPAGRPTIENELTVALKAMGGKRIVVGHTPTLKGVTILYGGRLVQIDTGISKHYGGPLGWLEILGDRLVPHKATRSGK
jgi:hypothetical protein